MKSDDFVNQSQICCSGFHSFSFYYAPLLCLRKQSRGVALLKMKGTTFSGGKCHV